MSKSIKFPVRRHQTLSLNQNKQKNKFINEEMVASFTTLKITVALLFVDKTFESSWMIFIFETERFSRNRQHLSDMNEVWNHWRLHWSWFIINFGIIPRYTEVISFQGKFRDLRKSKIKIEFSSIAANKDFHQRIISWRSSRLEPEVCWSKCF